MSDLCVCALSSDPPVRLAAAELRRYLTHITGAPVSSRLGGRTSGSATIRLGLFSQLGLPQAKGSDPDRDDEIYIAVDTAGGVIAGSNPRSVLIAAYRYLTELGCRWVRPGKTGEYLPRLGPQLPSVHVREAASYRHRGVCIEGAVSWEHVRDMVDWIPKLGFNAYFIQFREAYNFFQRWYAHEGNPTWRGREFTLEEARELTRRLRAEVKKRGLFLHMVGHGWTCEPFGIPGLGWFAEETPIPPEAVEHLAEVNGKRQLFGNVALNTNLCYGNPRTRAIVTDAIVEYARENPDVDIIHFWLADGCNNHCECPLCRDHRPSDLYVRMLNELDDKLTAAGLPTRIVFLAYVDLLWPPQRERIRNPQRFILMFAPITRSYSSSFTEHKPTDTKLPPYRRNRLQFPSDPGANLAFLRAWQSQFPGEGFDFDYHLMWDHYKDPSQYASARILHKDIQGLRRIGLDGFMSCQVQRVFFPTGLTMTVMGRTLWNRGVKFQDIVSDYCQAAFGDGGGFVEGYLKTLSRLFSPPVIRGEGSAEEVRAALRGWRRIPKVVANAQEAITAGLQSPDPCHAHSWRLLQQFGELACLLSAALLAKHEGTPESARAAAQEVARWAWEHERSIHPEFDVFLFLLTMGGVLGFTAADLGETA